MLDLIALLCLLSIPVFVVIVGMCFIAAIISVIVKHSEVKIVEKNK